ncbi:hypothetical protein TREMEDRAFT_28761, partial [Tremella mesenterica DSM 1558]|uniref:uncharacterized protein n=1 Tax=Tremella mesenterica (strain ATCC 24925 / CBS 8224 / DSM 1558 / NBRC 9311 / NRRL Y-6157 / RJB 2259-6 / UBC 559-6) TaxID=578456 RepID=UPI0003F48FC1
NLNPYPSDPSPYPSSQAPQTGPGAGFPPRSGLAGMQPNSYASYAPPTGTSGGRAGLGEERNVAQIVSENTGVYARKFQALLDRSTPHVMERWGVTAVLGFVFVLNVVLRQGWYIVCYALAIYILNLFLAFLQPRFDPSLAADLAADDVEEGAPGLPGSETKSPGGLRGLMNGFSAGGEDEEFRPFIRRLPEFKFWYSSTRATAIALLCTITRATDVPVYWPILLIYFLTLFGLTMRRQIQHMIKYRYVPFDLGKKTRYGKK